ncbi:hypothetical protein Tco_0747617 [Tanacetum coccineum]|uniref:Uncharacterized protein n=1 Tax=Tanacetum coccineum TaxID=301880 RepID=A0ABQ4YVS7_9ASTR
MSTYLKNMAGYKHNQLKNKSFNDIQNLFEKAMKRVNTFVDMDTKLVEGSKVRIEGSETRTKGSSKRAGEDLQQESIKKQKMYLVFSHMLKSFDMEDLETLWKLVKAKHGSTRLEEGYERVLWGDLKIMFDPHVEDQGRIFGIKRLHDDLEVTAAKVCVTAAKLMESLESRLEAAPKLTYMGRCQRLVVLDDDDDWRILLNKGGRFAQIDKDCEGHTLYRWGYASVPLAREDMK